MLMTNGFGPLLHLTYENGQIDTLYSTIINSYTLQIAQDKKGNIWAANGSGLIKIEVAKDTMMLYSIENGLEHDMVVDLIIDDEDEVWVYTPNGVAKFDQATEQFINYRVLEDFSPSNRQSKSLVKTKSGIIRVLTTRGILSFDPKKIKKSQITPTLIISDIKASGKSILPNQPKALKKSKNEFSLSHFQNDLSIDFIGINFDDAPKQQYQYQLEGINENWVDAGTERTARFPNLPAGNYTFKVKAANADGVWSNPKNADGVWSNPKSLKITINPPWWQTWWAYLVYALLLIGLLTYWYRSLQQKIKNKEAQLEKERAFNTELTELNAANQRFVPNDFLQILGKKS